MIHRFGSIVGTHSRERVTEDTKTGTVDPEGACDLDGVGVLAIRQVSLTDDGVETMTGYAIKLAGPLIKRDDEHLDAVYVVDTNGLGALIGELCDGAYRAGGSPELDRVLAIAQAAVAEADRERNGGGR